MNDLMIEAHDLRKRFGSTVALDGVDLEVPAGAILGVLGPNGAGKTTAVRILTTLSAPDSGTARIAGHDVAREGAAVRASIGVTAQDATLDEVLTGRENLVMIGRLGGLRRAQARVRAAELLDQFDLVEAADRILKEYSGGMRRRLDLAAGLLTRPPVLFLDEPTTGLDPTSRVRMWGVIRELVAEGVTLLLTTQYLDEADELADRIVVIDHGRVIAGGTAAKLKGQIGGARLELMLTDAHPRAATAIEPFVAGPVRVSHDGRRLRAPVPSSVGLASTVVRALDEAGITVDDVELRQPSLDDVFFALTGHPPTRPGTAPRSNPLTQTWRSPTHESHHSSGSRHTDSQLAGAGQACPDPLETHPLMQRLRDVAVLTGRNLRHIKREPLQLSDVTVQPVLFTLLFVYVFGSGVAIPGGGSYVDFAIAGLLAMNLTTSAMGTAVGLSTDLGSGVIDRFRTLSMWRPAVLVGRSFADVLTAALCAAFVAVTGLIIGWRPDAGIASILAGFALFLLFSYALSWGCACLGMVSKSPESAQGIGLVILFPLAIVSNALVPTEHMPVVLRTIADWNPVSAVTTAARQLFGNPTPSAAIHAWPLQHPVVASLLWSIVLIAVFAPLATALYRRRTTD